MFDNEFDELFRSRLKDHPSAVPEDMWQRISGRAAGRRLLSPWRWYFIVPMLLLAGLLFMPHRATSPATHPAIASSNHAPASPAKPAVAPASRPPAIAQTTTSLQPTVASAKSSPESPQTHSVSVPAIRSGSVPRSQSEPVFISTAARRRTTTRRRTATRRSTAPATTISVLLRATPRTTPTSTRLIPAKGYTPPSTATIHTHHGLPALEPLFARPLSSPFAYRPQTKGIPCPNPEEFKEKSGWFAELYFSPDILFTNRRAGFSWSAGARFGKTFNDRFSATVGLEFSRISLGIVSDSLEVPQQFNSIDIPLLLGYQFGSADFNTTVHAGVLWNLQSQPVGPNFGIPYRTNTGVAFYFGLDFLKSLNSHWSVFAEPHFRYQLSNRPIDLRQAPDLGGLSLGVRYNFLRRAGNR